MSVEVSAGKGEEVDPCSSIQLTALPLALQNSPELCEVLLLATSLGNRDTLTPIVSFF